MQPDGAIIADATSESRIVRVFVIKLVVVVAAVSLTLGVLEIVCRVQSRFVPQPQGFPTAMTRNWLDRHGQRNTLGFRDREPVAGPRPLLAVVGDSFAFGWGIERTQDRYGEQLAAMLGWDSMNAALPDTHTLDHIASLDKVLPLRPRAVILLYVFNDIQYLSPTRLWPAVPLRPLFERSHLFQQIAVRFKHLLPPKNFVDGYKDPEILARHAADLKRFTDLAARDGALVVIVPFIRMIEDGGRYAKLVAAARDAEAPIWPIDTAFAGYKLETIRINSFDSHPNELAHRIAAEATLPYFEKTYSTTVH